MPALRDRVHTTPCTGYDITHVSHTNHISRVLVELHGDIMQWLICGFVTHACLTVQIKSGQCEGDLCWQGPMGHIKQHLKDRVEQALWSHQDTQ